VIGWNFVPSFVLLSEPDAVHPVPTSDSLAVVLAEEFQLLG
jgi:hypothetical protein